MGPFVPSLQSTMKLFRKILNKDEKVLDEARDLAVDRLKQYFADRQTATKDILRPLIKSVTRLCWWLIRSVSAAGGICLRTSQFAIEMNHVLVINIRRLEGLGS